MYDLYAVSQHSGSLSGGHYTAICQNALDLQWYNFNDSSVRATSVDRIVTPEAYVLFYRRRGSVPDLASRITTFPSAPEGDKNSEDSEWQMVDII